MAQAISKADLFSRLAEGHAARTMVVTPNRRLSQGLMAEFDAHQAARGLAAWEAPDILPLEAFMVRVWEDAFYSERDLPLLLTGAQEQAIWEEILAGSELLSIPQTATQCRDAWRLAHPWGIPAGPRGGGAPAVPRRGAARARLAHPGGSRRRRRAGVPRLGAQVRGAHTRRDRFRPAAGLDSGFAERGGKNIQPKSARGLRIRHRSAPDQRAARRLYARALRSRARRRQCDQALVPLGAPGARARRGVGARTPGGGG